MSDLDKILAKEIVNRLIEDRLFEFGDKQVEELFEKGEIKESLWLELLRSKNTELNNDEVI